jgi:hypothetical protein
MEDTARGCGLEFFSHHGVLHFELEDRGPARNGELGCNQVFTGKHRRFGPMRNGDLVSN